MREGEKNWEFGEFSHTVGGSTFASCGKKKRERENSAHDDVDAVSDGDGET